MGWGGRCQKSSCAVHASSVHAAGHGMNSVFIVPNLESSEALQGAADWLDGDAGIPPSRLNIEKVVLFTQRHARGV